MPLSSKDYDMEKLLGAVSTLVCLVSPDKIKAIASRIRQIKTNESTLVLIDMVAT
jgi:cardiolipin synthase